MTRTVFAGIDGGGTKTVVVLVDETGAELTRVQASTSNAAVVGHAAAGSVLRDALEEALGGSGTDVAIASAWFGLSGSDRPDDHDKLKPFFQHLTGEIRMTNDAELILGALPDSVGLAIVSGTGSIAVGRNARGEQARSGGWGQIIGDEGSGYDFARRMFQAFARNVDGRGPSTSLTTRLISHLALSEPHHLIAFVYKPETSKGDIARLARIVIEEAETGDRVAREIIAASANELVVTASAAAQRLGFKGVLPLALTGSMFIHVECFRRHVIEGLRTRWPDLDHHVVDDPALTAARSLARPPAKTRQTRS